MRQNPLAGIEVMERLSRQPFPACVPTRQNPLAGIEVMERYGTITLPRLHTLGVRIPWRGLRSWREYADRLRKAIDHESESPGGD